MPLRVRDVKQALTSKGFKEDIKRDHCYYFLLYGGKKTRIFTKISHGEREIDDSLCGQMAKQVGLTTGQFRDLIDCDLKEEPYIHMLIQAKIVEPKREPCNSRSKPRHT